MDTLQNRKGIIQFVVAALVAAALCGCAPSREQPPASNANANVAAAPVVAPPITQAAKAKPAATREARSQAASSKSSSVAILAQIHQADLKEIAIGKMAAAKASTSEVRAYANRLVEDHTNADQTVLAMAQKMGVHLHENAHAKLPEKKLNSASGAEFDRRFLEQTSADHKRLISELKREREDASNDDIEALIDKIMPILEQHRELAQILMKKEQA
jgi:putative membrane protein